MTHAIGFVLVSQVYTTGRSRCAKCPPGRLCYYPKPPRCNAACVHSEKLLAKHPECRKYDREVTAFYKDHPDVTTPNGRTNIGPLHYFRECAALKPRKAKTGGRGRVVDIDLVTAETLGLPTCETCQARMAPFESQFEEAHA